MADKNIVALLFDWLARAVFEQNNLHETGGALRLLMFEAGAFTDVRMWPILESSKEASVAEAKSIAEQIAGEAEAACEGRGGGATRFTVRVYRQAERQIVMQRPFTVTLEDGAIQEDEASSRGLSSQLMRQNAELHKVIMSMAPAVISSQAKIIQSLSESVQRYQSLEADNLSLLKANIENRDGREASAFLELKKHEEWAELKQMVVPHVLQWLAERANQKDD